MKSIEDLLQLLKNVLPQKNGTWKACCPAHNDGHHKGEQSLSIELKNDKILLHCFAGCKTTQIVETLGLKMSDLFLNKPDKPLKTRATRGQKEIEKIYPYTDFTGELIFEVVRYKPKAFRQRRPDGQGGYIWDLKGIERVIYRLPQITAAIARGDTIYHVEGEKDADNLVRMGLEATTSPMGAESWRESLAKYYTGAEQVIILPDKDGPGRAYANNVARDIYTKVKSVKIIELPGDKVKDASDWINAGGIWEEFKALVAAAPVWRPPLIDPLVLDYDSTNALLKKRSDDGYCILNRAFHRIIHTREGDTIEQPICNFTARIIEEILK